MIKELKKKKTEKYSTKFRHFSHYYLIRDTNTYAGILEKQLTLWTIYHSGFILTPF